MEEQRILNGQTALVTGANSGIGAEIARVLGAAGARVVVNYVSDEANAGAVVEAIRASGSDGLAVQADVSNEAQVQALFAQAEERFGIPDILVNNAGIQQDADLVEMSLAQWQKVIDVNLTGQFLCAREAVRALLRRGPVGHSPALGKIIGISSVHDTIPWAGHSNYTASKGGVALLMKSLAQELAPHRIRVNLVSPGAIRTDINRSSWEHPEQAKALMKLIPYGRIGEVTDVAKVVRWLASDESDYITGETIYIDGGMTLYPGFREAGE